MPWHIENDNPECSGYAVVKDDGGEVEGCHRTKADAMKQMAALYAEEPMMSDEPTGESRETHPRDDLYRAMPGGVTSEDGKTLTIRLAPADTWAEINSVAEGHFMERFARSAYRKTMAEQKPKMLFQHGKDPEVGEKPIATTDEVGEDDISPFARGEILDGVPALVVDGLRKGVYGASHRFSVMREAWSPPLDQPVKSGKLRERTITEARLFELGPVTWPAYAGASAALRSITDEMRGLTPTSEPEAPSLDAEAETPHLEPERRDEPVVVAAIQQEERAPVSEYISRDEKAARVVELREALTRQATEYPGVLPPEAQERWDADNAEIESLERDIAAWDARVARVAALSGDPKHVETVGAAPAFVRKQTVEDIHDIGKILHETRNRAEFVTRVRENALRSIDGARFAASAKPEALVDLIKYRDEGPDGEGEVAQRVLATGSPVYRRAFNKYLRGDRDLWSPEERAAIAVVGTTTTGGYAVPYVFDPTMLHIGAWTSQNPFRANCRVETITNGNNWRTVTVGAVTSAFATEALTASENAPTFGQPTYTVQRANAYATISIETLEDRSDIVTELTSVFAESKDTLEENQFAVGVGTTVYPMGMFTDTAYTNKDTAANDSTAIADLLAVEGDLPLRHRANGTWFMNRSTIRQFITLDTTYRYFSGAGIQYAGQSSPARTESGNTGLSLLGYPVVEVPSAVSTLTTDGAIIAVFCDPRSYIIVDRIGMNVEVIQNVTSGATPNFPTGQRGIFCYWRTTAKPINADAGRSLSVQ